MESYGVSPVQQNQYENTKGMDMEMNATALSNRYPGGSNDVIVEPFDLCSREAANVNSIENFKEWIRNFVRPILPHGALACVHGRIYGVGVSLDYVVTIDYPLKHLSAIRNASGHMDTPLARRWIERQGPVLFDARYPSADIPEGWLKHFRTHDLANAAIDGVMDRVDCIATYFSFHQLPVLNEQVVCMTFKTLIPLLHKTFVRVIRIHQERANPSHYSLLTEREQEIAMLVSQGKSNVDISTLLGVSENTIRNHISRILDKTGCSNRAGLAVAVTIQEQHRFGMGTKVL